MSFVNQELFDITYFLKCREKSKHKPTYCGLCGRKFSYGNKARWLFTNSIEGYGGNPMICEHCDEGRESNLARWKTTVNDFNANRFKACRQIYCR